MFSKTSYNKPALRILMYVGWIVGKYNLHETFKLRGAKQNNSKHKFELRHAASKQWK